MSKTIDLHFFTGGMGGAGKTTLLANTLCYFSNEKNNDSLTVMVFDEGDNTDFTNFWGKCLSVGTLKDNWRDHTCRKLSVEGDTTILAFEPHPKKTAGPKWHTIIKIILDYEKTYLAGCRDYKIVALIDTGWSIGSVLKNADSVPDLPENINWAFYPWILWTPNSIANQNFIETTKVDLSDFENKLHDRWPNCNIHAFHVFNPILVESENISINNTSRNRSINNVFHALNSIINTTPNQIIPIDSFIGYKSKPVGGEIDIVRFTNKMESFMTKLISDLGKTPLEVYTLIGRALNSRFVDNGAAYSNVFCIGFYDQSLALFKTTPGKIADKINKIRVERLKTESDDSLVKHINELMKEVNGSLCYNLDLYFSSKAR